MRKINSKECWDKKKKPRYCKTTRFETLVKEPPLYSATDNPQVEEAQYIENVLSISSSREEESNTAPRSPSKSEQSNDAMKKESIVANDTALEDPGIIIIPDCPPPSSEPKAYPRDAIYPSDLMHLMPEQRLM